VEFTLDSGERVSTLAESRVFELPAASGTLAAVESAILAAKVKRQGGEADAVNGGR
jgi:S-adenosylhomocysteine hydrolase